MDFSGGPAALGGVMMCIALGAWSMGRWQALRTAGDDPSGVPGGTAAMRGPALAPVEPCQHAARTERRLALPTDDRLGELHVEISAYRRAEQVLAKIEGDVLPLHPAQAEPGRNCRYLGIVGEPTCNIPAAARALCACGTGCDQAEAMPSLRAVQPSPTAGDGMRV
jgi:hypothetical protein